VTGSSLGPGQGSSLLSVKLTDVVEAVVGSLLLVGHSVLVSGPSPHGDVQLDECLIIAGWGVDDCIVFWRSRAS